MQNFNVYVIESNGEYYYSLKGADFGKAEDATLFRSEKAANALIRKAIREKEYFIDIYRRRGSKPDHIEEEKARWETTTKVIKIS